MTRLGFAVVAVAILSVAQTASAHFSLTYPPTRGFSESIEANAPCGGYDTPSANRSSFLLKDGFVEINAEHPSYTYQVNILINSNPTSADFTSSNLVTVASGQNSFPLAACIPVNLTDVSGATNGTLATLQVTFNGGDGALYQVGFI
ncbi:hypothetical protein J3Q64DRAFT_1719188 [Phycomyces blakesleeanus]|uniref:Copper acquisition factor BIM1-like domain-containing protein n=1 Tax=Phycomyces blakesleeanus TaxID=4837 RepID=A0ABR3B9D2_PHYBL